MLRIEYIAPEVTLLCCEVEQGFGVSQGSPNVNIGIGGWETDEENYGGDIRY